MRRKVTTVVTRVPKSLHDSMKFWKKALNFNTEKEAWNHIERIYGTKTNRVYPKEIFKI